MFYFAYGKNTNSNIMLTRIPEAKFHSYYTLKGWELKFHGHIKTQKSFLDVVPNPNSEVHGIIWWLPKECKRFLDLEEGLYYHFTFKLDSGERVFSYTMVKTK